MRGNVGICVGIDRNLLLEKISATQNRSHLRQVHFQLSAILVSVEYL